MSKPIPLPSQEYITECFHYDPDTGLLTWKERPLHHFKNLQVCKAINNTYLGKTAGFLKVSGYCRVVLNKKEYNVNRIIWKYVTKEEPLKSIDHINGIKTDNRFINLREATHSQNSFNRKIDKDSSTGFKGVCFNKATGKYRSFIHVNRKQLFIGGFNSAQEAHDAYCQKALEHYGEFANFGYQIE